ncbi:hypothetical protein [Actinocrispum sp. NPDC049592]|uniref:hypothetical protein n=1 Tax=Actinocrispum sp. NPDC049592 TaxID=3154835 RepID=UPI0034275B23
MTDLEARTVNEVVEAEVTQFWLRPGERLVLAVDPMRGYAATVVGGQVRVPHVAIRPTPAVTTEPPKWPLPVQGALDDWTDDPTLAYWAAGQSPDQLAIRVADHLAASHGDARLVLTDQRVAVLYPSKILAEPSPDGPFTTFEQAPATAVRGFVALLSGRSVPPCPVLRIDFADGSTLLVRDVLAAKKVVRSQTASRGPRSH